MTRADEILALISSGENYESDSYYTSMLKWMGEQDDERLVEFMRGAASTLAYRMVTPEDRPIVAPTGEVFMTALRDIAKEFQDHIKREGHG